MKSIIILLLCFIVVSIPARAENANNQSWQFNTTQNNIPISPLCTPGSISICGKIISVPATVLGTLVSLKVPSPYVHQSFTAQCVVANGIEGYQIVDATAVTCTLPTCGPGPLSVCGSNISISETVPVGSSINVPIAGSFLPNPSSKPDQSIHVQCVDDGNSIHYQIKEGSQLSCNQMPCPDAQINLCNSSISVPGGAMLGTVVHMNMPQPFAPDPFTVQCVGSGGNAPVYQVIEHEAVTCSIPAATR